MPGSAARPSNGPKISRTTSALAWSNGRRLARAKTASRAGEAAPSNGQASKPAARTSRSRLLDGDEDLVARLRERAGEGEDRDQVPGTGHRAHEDAHGDRGTRRRSEPSRRSRRERRCDGARGNRRQPSRTPLRRPASVQNAGFPLL
jgi:hypothetical protein